MSAPAFPKSWGTIDPQTGIETTGTFRLEGPSHLVTRVHGSGTELVFAACGQTMYERPVTWLHNHQMYGVQKSCPVCGILFRVRDTWPDADALNATTPELRANRDLNIVFTPLLAHRLATMNPRVMEKHMARWKGIDALNHAITRLRALWHRYNNMLTPESRRIFVKLTREEQVKTMMAASRMLATSTGQ